MISKKDALAEEKILNQLFWTEKYAECSYHVILNLVSCFGMLSDPNDSSKSKGSDEPAQMHALCFACELRNALVRLCKCAGSSEP